MNSRQFCRLVRASLLTMRATHATVKVLGAALGGGDAERKARAIAIWMPSDTARVREACSGK